MLRFNKCKHLLTLFELYPNSSIILDFLNHLSTASNDDAD